MEPDETEILATEDRRFRATLDKDMPVLDALIADDLRYVHSNGATESKAEFLRKLASGERTYGGYRALARTTHREGGFSFVFGEAAVSIARPGGDLDMRLTYTAVYRNAPTPRLMAWHSVRSGGG